MLPKAAAKAFCKYPLAPRVPGPGGDLLQKLKLGLGFRKF